MSSAATPLTAPAHDDFSLWTQLRIAWADSRPVVASAAVALLFFVLTYFSPLQMWWRGGFQAGRVYLWWPLIVYGAAVSFPLLGVFHHHRSGRGMYRPALAAMASWLLGTIPLVLVTDWAASRSELWFFVVLWLGGIAAICIAVGCVAYRETWRTRDNARVCACVRRALRNGGFRRYVRALLRRRAWASPHCLLVVNGWYEETKSELRNNLRSEDTPRAVTACVNAGEMLVDYLRLPRAANTEWTLRRMNVLRELATLCLWAAAVNPRVRVNRNRLNGWMNEMARAVPESLRDYVAFLHAVFTLRSIDARAAGELLALFGGIPSHAARAIACDTWIAIAPARVDGQTAIDLWIALHGAGVDPLTSMRTDASDPASAWAHERAAEVYERWLGRTPEEWRAPLAAREKIAAAAAHLAPADPDVIRRETEARAAEESSWPYHYVWSTPAVMTRLVAWTIVLALVHTIAVLAVIPGVVNNRVEAIRDLRPFRDYRDTETRAVAATPETIALATGRGLLFFDKDSRVVHPHDDAGTLDVTRGPAGHDFISLGEDQSIRGVTPRLFGRDTVWIDPPAHPEWTGGAGAPLDVVRSSIDADGWLLAARGRGIARYEFASGVRTRSWQQSELAQIDLRDAIFTSAGAWIRTPSLVTFADRKTLQPQTARKLNVAAEAIDAGPSGTWATARRGGSAWLFDGNWSGPYFCGDANALTDLSQVTIARAKPQRAWLGAANGLYRYDAVRRCLSTSIRDEEIRYLAEAKTGSMFVAGNTKLWLVPVAGSPATIDVAGQLSSPSLSPDGTVAFYRAGQELRRLDLSSKVPQVVIDGKGWASESQPDILAVRASEPRSLLFVTSRGAFRYDPRRRSYEDASKTDDDGVLQSLGGVELTADRTLALSNGRPYALRNGTAVWHRLDPSGKRNAVQLTEAGGQAFGLARDGRIHRYEGTSGDSLATRSEALRRYGAPKELAGDLLPGDPFRIAIAAGNTLVEARPGTFALKDHPTVMHEEPRQLRYASDGSLLMLTGAGTVRTAPAGNPLFGDGSLAVPLGQLSAIAPDRDGTSVIAGGANGTVARYDWSTGSWTEVVSPDQAGRNHVTSLQKTPAGLLVGTSTEDWYYAANGQVSSLGRHRRVVPAGGALIALDSKGLHAMAIGDGGQWRTTTYAYGEGVTDVLSNAVIAWQGDPETISFLGRDGAGARYDLATDFWHVNSGGTSRALEQLQRSGASVFAVDGNRVVRIAGDLGLQQLHEFSAKPSLHAQGDVTRIAGVSNGRLVLRTAGGDAIQRGGFHSPSGFDLTDVVFATDDDSMIALVDRRGRIVHYEPSSGAWTSRFAPRLTEKLLGWTRGGLFHATRIYLRTLDGKFISVRLDDGERDDVEELPDTLLGPGDGELLDSGGIVLRRTGGVTSATHRTLGPLHFLAGRGFEEDWYSGAGFDASGGLHAMTAIGVIRFREEDGRLVFASAPEPRELPVPPPDQMRVFVTQTIGGHELRWTYRPGRGIQPEWQEAGLPRFGSCGRPSWQCVRDVAVTTDGELLVSTDLGVMVRDARTYELRRLFLAGAKPPRPAVPPRVAETGPLRWTMTQSGVTVTESGRAVVMTNGRFADDTVRWIHRTGNGLVLETEGKRWTFAGTRRERFTETLPEDSPRQETSAVIITETHGVLTFEMFDGRDLPAFADGRFVLDSVTEIAGGGADLFTLVPNRCVVRRSAADPDVITGVWSLPPGANGAVMDPMPSGVRLKHGNGITYALDPASGQWPESRLRAFEEVVQADAVVWRGQRGRGARYVPHHGALPLTGWWSASAFAWDRVSSVVALSHDLVAVASAGGLWTGRYSASGLETVAFQPGVESASAAEARRRGERIGAHFAAVDGKEWRVDAAGAIRVHDGSDVREHALVTFAMRERLRIEESWGDGPAARSTLAPDDARIDRGQFVFDGFRAGAAWGGSWVIASSRGPITVNAVTRSGLELRAVHPAPCRFAWLRGDRDRVSGVCKGAARARTADRATMAWSAETGPSTAEFRVGQQIAFFAPSMTWHARGDDVPWSSKPLTVHPSRYPLFAASATGTRLSFDDFTTVSYDSDTGALDVGTRGGMLHGSWKNGGTSMLRHGAAVLDFKVLDVVRLRRERGGALLVMTAGATSMARLKGQWSPAPLHRWPDPNGVRIGGTTVTRSDNAWGRGDRNIEGIIDYDYDPEAAWIATRHNGLFRIDGAIPQHAARKK